jgi:general secretion pathway protein D
MEKMLRLQQGVENGDKPGEKKDANGAVKLVQTGYTRDNLPDDVVIPQKLEKLRQVPFPGGVNLVFLIKELAKDLDLNVLIDAQSRLDNRRIKIDLKNVTSAKALDYIFLQEGLFFQKVGPRTILVADQNRRQNFQQLVLRTFYLANASPKDVAKVVQTAIPAQPGRTPTIPLIDESTNSITVRDTSENIKIIANLIAALDKDRAEVVMDVAIYEVTKSDLLRLGNQIGNEGALTSLGGTTRGVVGLGGNDIFGTLGRAAADVVPSAFGVGLVIPAVNLIAFNRKSDAKIIASTQIHAFNNEDSSARIGQRVPVQTAQLLGYNNQPGQQQNNFNFGNAASVVNYEQVGLTLKFKPIVFPNQDVQVAMEIESKDVAAGGTPENPVFTERTIKGTARIQNNKTLLLASVATGSEVKGREGLPLLGLIPILGRLFTAPTRNNNQVDIVIAITPRVIRAPAILPEDEVERPTGSLATPTSGSLEAMIIQEEVEEQLAAARRLPNTANVQLPDQPNEPAYVRSSSAPTDTSTATANGNQTSEVKQTETAEQKTDAVAQKTENPAVNLRPIDTSVKTLQITPTAGSAEDTINKVVETSLKPEVETLSELKTESSAPPSAEISMVFDGAKMKKGEKVKIPVMVKSATAFRSAVLGLNFDAEKLAVRSVTFGDVFGEKVMNTPASPFANKNGKMYVSLWTIDDTARHTTGVLAYIEIEALETVKPVISFDGNIMNLLTVDGKYFAVKY